MICPSCGHDNIEGMDRCENCMKPLRDLDVPRAEAASGLVRSAMEDDLSRLGRDEALTVSPNTPALDVVRRMKAAQTSCALVVDNGNLVGIFTEHDVLCKMADAKASGQNFAVGGLMASNPETLRETDSVAAALNKMSIGRYRHVPIMRGDGTYGVTSIEQVLKYIEPKDW